MAGGQIVRLCAGTCVVFDGPLGQASGGSARLLIGVQKELLWNLRSWQATTLALTARLQFVSLEGSPGKDFIIRLRAMLYARCLTRGRRTFVGTKYVHTNLVARDWRELGKFYVEVFGCKPKPPERDLKGGWVDNLTSLGAAHIQGMHLLMPGSGRNGPTLEIFQYNSRKRRVLPQTDQLGFGHIAFAVEDVGRTLKKIKEKGGGLVGKRISAEIEGVGRLDVVYARDPEGNIIEVQRWE